VLIISDFGLTAGGQNCKSRLLHPGSYPKQNGLSCHDNNLYNLYPFNKLRPFTSDFGYYLNCVNFEEQEEERNAKPVFGDSERVKTHAKAGEICQL
jgi:hypothetical protein